MTVKEALLYAKQKLKNVPDRDVDAAWIVGLICGLRRGELHIQTEKILTPQQEEVLGSVLNRRAAREPLQYIFGRVPFFNIALKTDRRALIPRDETALLTELAVSLIRQKGYRTLLDLGTGSGAIALACKFNVPALAVCAADISSDALALAEENARELNLGVELKQSDSFSALDGPYIAQADLEKLERELFFEPQNALDGGPDGLDFYRIIIAQAADHLNAGGMLMFEMGAGQRETIEYLLLKAGFSDITVTKDYAGIERIIHCFKEEKT